MNPRVAYFERLRDALDERHVNPEEADVLPCSACHLLELLAALADRHDDTTEYTVALDGELVKLASCVALLLASTDSGPEAAAAFGRELERQFDAVAGSGRHGMVH